MFIFIKLKGLKLLLIPIKLAHKVCAFRGNIILIKVLYFSQIPASRTLIATAPNRHHSRWWLCRLTPSSPVHLPSLHQYHQYVLVLVPCLLVGARLFFSTCLFALLQPLETQPKVSPLEVDALLSPFSQQQHRHQRTVCSQSTPHDGLSSPWYQVTRNLRVKEERSQDTFASGHGEFEVFPLFRMLFHRCLYDSFSRFDGLRNNEHEKSLQLTV